MATDDPPLTPPPTNDASRFTNDALFQSRASAWLLPAVGL